MPKLTQHYNQNTQRRLVGNQNDRESQLMFNYENNDGLEISDLQDGSDYEYESQEIE